MTDQTLHVLGIGNAIVDVIAQAEDAFLQERGIEKGAMILIDDDGVETLYQGMGPGIEISGGSAANTIAGVASLGGQCAYFGRVRDDQWGKVFAHDLRALGVEFESKPADAGPATARSLINVTPDSQRTMCTYLGASSEFSLAEIDQSRIKRAKITYMEGYLFDRDPAKEAMQAAARMAKEAGGKVAFTLSDSFCVERHRADILKLIDSYVDILFANEAEILSLFEVSAFDAASSAAGKLCDLTAITRSEKGSILLPKDGTAVEISAVPPKELEDTTGAGDLYAAGVLYGVAEGLPLETCGNLGALAASEVISHYGARPEVDLRELAQGTGLI